MLVFHLCDQLTSLRGLTDREKFRLAREDSFDQGTFALAALFAGEGQIEEQLDPAWIVVKRRSHTLHNPQNLLRIPVRSADRA